MNPKAKRNAERRMLTEMQILCNVCGVPCLTTAEARIGVHVACVQEVNNRRVARIPRPGYGANRRPMLEPVDANE